MGNLTRYTLSWSFFVASLCALSGPVCDLIQKFAETESGKTLLSVIIVGGVLPFGYTINLVPLMVFRLIRSTGVFHRSKRQVTEGWFVTEEMESQCNILRERLRALSDPEKVMSFARQNRSDRWTHLIVHYNLISSLMASVLVWITTALLKINWSIGFFGILGKSVNLASFVIVLGPLVIVFVALLVTAMQTRWELIRSYRIESDRLEEMSSTDAIISAGQH